MKPYEWDLDLLLQKEKELNEKVNLYQEELSVYRALINNYSIDVYESRKKHDKYFEDDVEENVNCLSLDDFKENVSCYSNMAQLQLLNNSMEILKNYSYKYDHRILTPCHLNNNELVDYVIYLANKLPNEHFINFFNNFTNQEKHLLHIKHQDKLPTGNRGLTFVDTEKHIPYGLIARENTIHDIITLGHELFHMVVRQNEEPFFLDSTRTVYTEAEGYFANMLFGDLLLEEHYPKDDISFLNGYDLKTTADVINDTFVTTIALNNFENNNKIDFKELKKYLTKYNITTPINKKNFKGYLSNYFNYDANDASSYLVALDLYNLYKKDPEKALYNVLKIPNLEGNNIQKDLESINVTFFEDGYQNLDNHCKQLLKRRTTSSK